MNAYSYRLNNAAIINDLQDFEVNCYIITFDYCIIR